MTDRRNTSRVPWVTAERQCARELRPQLASALDLTREAQGLVTEVLDDVGPRRRIPLPRHASVQIRMLANLSRQLRMIEIAAISGYPVQAFGMCATVYELAHGIAYIGTDDERAAKWEEHTEHDTSFPGAKHRKRGAVATLIAFGSTPAEAERDVWQQEEDYALFCMAKHGNPLLLRRFGVRFEEDGMWLQRGPSCSERSAAIGQLALFHSGKLVLGAARVLWKPLAPTEKQAREAVDTQFMVAAGALTRLRGDILAAVRGQRPPFPLFGLPLPH